MRTLHDAPKVRDTYKAMIEPTSVLTLEECLSAAYFKVKRIHEGISSDQDFASRIEAVAVWLEKHGFKPTHQQFIDDLSHPELPSNYLQRDICLALWIQADHAFDRGALDESWYHLLRANYFIGMANGPMSAEEQKLKSPTTRWHQSQPLKDEIIRLLKLHCPEGKWLSLNDAIDDILLEVTLFNNKMKAGKASNPREKIKEWRREDPSVKAAFEAALATVPKRGRPKGVTKKTAKAKTMRPLR